MDLSFSPADAAVNLLLAFLAFGLVFAGFEAALRTGVVEDDSTPRVKICGDFLGYSETRSFHPVYGWTKKPNMTYMTKRASSSEWEVFTTNSRGFRDTYDSGARNAVVLGDSFTYGVLVGDNETFSHLLDRWTPGTSFHNYGLPGSGPGQQLLIYRSLSGVNHSLVIVGYYLGNDAIDVTRDHDPSRPIFYNGERGLRQVQFPEDRNSGRGVLGGGVLNTVQEEVVADNLMSYRFFYLNAFKPLLASGGGKPRPPEGQERERQLRLAGALLDEISREAASRDAEVLIVGIPERGEVVPGNPSHYPVETGQPYWDDQRRMLDAVAENNSNTRFLDLKPLLVQERNSTGRNLYGTVNGHLDDYGHRFTARVIYRDLVENRQLESSSPDFSRSYSLETASCPG